MAITPIKTLLIGLALLQAKFSPDTSPGNRPEAHSVFTRTDEAKAKSNRFFALVYTNKLTFRVNDDPSSAFLLFVDRLVFHPSST